MEGIQRLWSLKMGSSHVLHYLPPAPRTQLTRPLCSGDELLVLGFFNETRVLSLTSATGPDAEDEIEEVELAAFAGDEPTLLACSVGGLLVQVTTAGASYSREDGSGAAKWTTEGGKKVTLAAAEGEHVLLAVEGGVLVLLGVQDGQLVHLG